MSGTALHLPDRTVWLDTASGSRYRVDPRAMTWARLSHDPRSDAVRSAGGPLLGLLAPPAVGRPAVILGPGYSDPGLVRWIVTTPVVRVWDSEPDVAHRAVDRWWNEDRGAAPD